MIKLILGTEKPDSEALQQMRERNRPETQWAAFQNHALDSADLGGLRFLQVGEGCTFAAPPERYPDTQFGTGWRYLHCGFVNLETGEIEGTIEASKETQKPTFVKGGPGMPHPWGR